MNLGSERAYVTYNPDAVTVAEMAKAIEEAGYQYIGTEEEETWEIERKAREADLNDKRWRIGIARLRLRRPDGDQ